MYSNRKCLDKSVIYTLVQDVNIFCSLIYVCALTTTLFSTQDTWLYHLTVAAGSSATFKVGTEYEQLIGKLLDAEGGPGEKLKGNYVI